MTPDELKQTQNNDTDRQPEQELDENALTEKIQQMCDEDREEEVISMIDALPESQKTYKIVGLEARTLSNLAGMIRNGYYDSELDPDELDRRALKILADTAAEGHDDPNWWCRNGYTRMNLCMEAEAIPFFERVMTLIPDDPETQEFWSDVPEAMDKCRKTIDFLNNPQQREPPYAKHRSLMIAIPREDTPFIDIDAISAKIAAIDGISDFRMERVDSKEIITVARMSGTFHGETFDAEIDFMQNFHPNGLIVGTYFTNADIEAVGNRSSGYTIDLQPGRSNPMRWLQLQFKMADIIVPRMLALYDLSARQMLSGHYVAMAASTDVLPNSDYAFSILSEDNGQGTDIWLYTTGLERFGLPDIEIMHTNSSHTTSHRKLINAVASYLLWHGYGEQQPVRRIDIPMARMIGDIPLYVRLLPWPEAIKDGQRDKATPGSLRMRLNMMNSNSCIIFTYADENAMETDLYQPLWMMDDALDEENADNTLYLLCEEEHKRASEMAQKTFWLPESIARQTPEKVWLRLYIADDEGNEEAVWLHVTAYTDRHNFVGVIDERPLRLELDVGEELHFIDDHENRLASWAIDTEDFRIIPDTIYVLDANPNIRMELGIN